MDENDKEEMKSVSKHPAMHFTKLCDINDDDYFEWNHGCHFWLIWPYYGRDEPNEVFCKKKQLITKHGTLSDVIFLMHHLDKRWSSFI